VVAVVVAVAVADKRWVRRWTPTLTSTRDTLPSCVCARVLMACVYLSLS
jgi:hypothetical protein